MYSYQILKTVDFAETETQCPTKDKFFTTVGIRFILAKTSFPVEVYEDESDAWEQRLNGLKAARANSLRFQSFANINENLSKVCQTFRLLKQKARQVCQTYQTCRFRNLVVTQTQIPSLPNLLRSKLAPNKHTHENIVARRC